ncbi:hypothetical protein SAMN05421759_1022 [Roseivivax lentus]|uniref:NrS-1 polymerase-like helicase domain-containing protein n=1 Tax=Roseivivax lentus TaxID=633194 RepID=A0A1N7KRJ8_9RHOB|nr:primase-helicase family protein [Roseivivax lentus]SIS64194.1 hypothetical protein SAMN05421759_1022 [Roseivivax lentus]
MLYSAQKGTGKGMFMNILAALFGQDNTTQLNGVEKLTQRFNATAVQSKLVTCDEVGGALSGTRLNALKSLFTEDTTTTERKGIEAEKIELKFNVVMASNELLTFAQEMDRRLYLVDTGHDGHASGPDVRAFLAIVEKVSDALRDPSALASLYRYLLGRPSSPQFNPNSLNTATLGTPLMQRIAAVEEPVQQQLREHLEGLGVKAVTAENLSRYANRVLHVRGTQLRDKMLALGWDQTKAKWDRASYSRAIWVAPGCTVDRGRVHCPGEAEKDLSAELAKASYIS